MLKPGLDLTKAISLGTYAAKRCGKLQRSKGNFHEVAALKQSRPVIGAGAAGHSVGCCRESKAMHQGWTALPIGEHDQAQAQSVICGPHAGIQRV